MSDEKLLHMHKENHFQVTWPTYAAPQDPSDDVLCTVPDTQQLSHSCRTLMYTCIMAPVAQPTQP
jgi:hypothetical protein